MNSPLFSFFFFFLSLLGLVPRIFYCEFSGDLFCEAMLGLCEMIEEVCFWLDTDCMFSLWELLITAGC